MRRRKVRPRPSWHAACPAIEAMIGRETIVEKGRERAIEAAMSSSRAQARCLRQCATRALKRRSHIPVAGPTAAADGPYRRADLLALGRSCCSAPTICRWRSVEKPQFDLSEDHVFEVAAGAATSPFMRNCPVAEEGSVLWQAVLQQAATLPDAGAHALRNDF